MFGVNPALDGPTDKDGYPKDAEKLAVNDVPHQDTTLEVGSSEDVLALQDVDPALNAKMHIVNNVKSSFHMLQLKFPLQ